LIIPWNRRIFFTLSVLPTVAFLIKATGLTTGLSILVCLSFQRRWRESIAYAATSGLTLFVVLGGLYGYSCGEYFFSFATGLEVGYRLASAMVPLSQPLLFAAVVFPMAFLKHVWPIHTGKQDVFWAVFIFYIVELVCNFGFSMRDGSNIYYFISAYSFGMMLLVKWLSAIGDPKSNAHREALILCLVMVVLQIGQIALYARSPWKEDVAVRKTKKYAADRPVAAGFINSKHWTCYSDDAGLNIMLERPVVIYPLLYQMLVESGAIQRPTLLDRIIGGEIDVVALTDLQWSYRGIENVSPSLMAAIEAHYMEKPVIGGVAYKLFVPRPRNSD
jgi:hypothetical protein